MANRDITTLGAVLKTTLEGEANTNFLTDADRDTLDALPTDLAGKSDVGHIHTIGDVSLLQAVLDNKSDDGHEHTIADITSLQTELNGKASSSHTHTSADVTDFQEAVEDIVGTLVQGDTTKGIKVTYDDAAGALDIELDLTAVTEDTDLEPSDKIPVQTAAGIRYVQWKNLRKIVLPISIANGDTTLTARTGAFTFRAPFAMYVEEVRASLTTGSSSGNVQIDVNVEGASIFTTPVTIDATEKTSTTALTPAVLTTDPTLIADDAEISVDVDLAGTNASGLKVVLIGYEA